MTSYQTNEELSAYFATKFHSDAWDDSTDDKQTRASYEATRILNQLNYIGCKVASDQENEFPRIVSINGVATNIGTPAEFLAAHSEIVYDLLDDKDAQKEYDALLVSSESFGPVRSTYDRSAVPENIVAGITSIVAWRLLQPYLRASQTVRLRRV